MGLTIINTVVMNVYYGVFRPCLAYTVIEWTLVGTDNVVALGVGMWHI